MTREFADARREDLGLLLANQVHTGALLSYRKNAFDLFAKHGLPSRRNESWKYTSLDTLAQNQFVHAATTKHTQDDAMVLPSLDAMRITITNGKVDEAALLKIQNSGLQIFLLTDAIQANPALLEQYLVGMPDPALALHNLNTALMDEGIYIRVPADTSPKIPLLLNFASRQSDSAVASYPRIIVEVEENASLVLIEYHEGANGCENFCNQVNQFSLASNAKLSHYSLQHGSVSDTHLCRTVVKAARSSSLDHYGMQFGGRLLRNEIDVSLNGVGANAHLSGLFLPTDKQHMDNQICVEHAAPETVSTQNYRGVLNEQGHGVFNGKVVVRETAPKTDARQSNRNLLLSNRAEIDTKPELEIYADDVKCSHGVTTGQIDQNQLFYLLSRGIDAQTAQSLLVFAFADAVIAPVVIPEIKEHLEQQLVGELPDTERIRNFV
ncbi:MAG: Fe-S cluster assembly protein SufD [Gammaproteobacteria bacterium]